MHTCPHIPSGVVHLWIFSMNILSHMHFTFVKVFVSFFSFFYFAAYKLLLVCKPYQRFDRNVDELRMSDFTEAGEQFSSDLGGRGFVHGPWDIYFISVAFWNDWFLGLEHFSLAQQPNEVKLESLVFSLLEWWISYVKFLNS